MRRELRSSTRADPPGADPLHLDLPHECARGAGSSFFQKTYMEFRYFLFVSAMIDYMLTASLCKRERETFIKLKRKMTKRSKCLRTIRKNGTELRQLALFVVGAVQTCAHLVELMLIIILKTYFKMSFPNNIQQN